jgi:hypothetical protein
VPWRCQCGIDAHSESPLWLVVCQRLGRTPWYLLTAEPVTTDADAWRIVFAYMHRWHIELTWRFNKSELAEHSSPGVASAGAREALGHGDAGIRLSLAQAFAAI